MDCFDVHRRHRVAKRTTIGDRGFRFPDIGQHVAAREKWRAAGRQIPGTNSAALRSLAIRQKNRFTATVSSSISQSYSFNINGVGTDPAAIAHSTAVNFTAMPSQNSDFTMTLTPTIAAVAAGQSTIFSLDIAPTTGTFPNNVTLSCSALPALTTCAFNPVQIDSGSGDSVITLSISTTHSLPRTARDAAMFLPTLPLAGLFWLALPAYRSKRRRIPLAALVVFLAVVCLSCGSGLQGNGGSGSPGTPPGTYNVKVTSGTLTHSTQLTLTVTT